MWRREIELELWSSIDCQRTTACHQRTTAHASSHCKHILLIFFLDFFYSARFDLLFLLDQLFSQANRITIAIAIAIAIIAIAEKEKPEKNVKIAKSKLERWLRLRRAHTRLNQNRKMIRRSTQSILSRSGMRSSSLFARTTTRTRSVAPSGTSIINTKKKKKKKERRQKKKKKKKKKKSKKLVLCVCFCIEGVALRRDFLSIRVQVAVCIIVFVVCYRCGFLCGS